jgi:hypothetical protein
MILEGLAAIGIIAIGVFVGNMISDFVRDMRYS